MKKRGRSRRSRPDRATPGHDAQPPGEPSPSSSAARTPPKPGVPLPSEPVPGTSQSVAAQRDDAEAVLAEFSSIDASDSDLILRRAIELSSAEELAVAERMPVSSIEQVAAELHVPVAAVADALAEYRAGAIGRSVSGPGGGSLDASQQSRDGQSSEGKGMLDRLVGPRSVKVRHRTGLSDREAAESLSEWLRRRHRLRIRINSEGTVVGVRRRGVVPVMVRSVRSATGRAGLAGVREVRGAAVSSRPGQTSICVVVDVSDQRTQSVVAGSAVALGGAVVVSVAAVVTAPMTLVGVPVAVGAGWVTSRVTHRYRVRRIEEEVEITADQVAAGALPSTLAQELGDRIGSARRPSKRESDGVDRP